MPIESWKEKAKRLKTDVHALFLAFREPNVPWYAKALMALIVGYAICPIDLIPDFIPVLGELDDLIIVPAGIALVMKMIPEATMEDCRRRAREEPINSKTKWIVTAIIVAIWIFAVYIVLKLVLPLLARALLYELGGVIDAAQSCCLPQVFSASQISSPHKALLGLLTRLRATITPFDRSYWPDKGRPRLYLVDWPSQLDSSCSARAIASKPPYT